jgi:hypothetical protein
LKDETKPGHLAPEKLLLFGGQGLAWGHRVAILQGALVRAMRLTMGAGRPAAGKKRKCSIDQSCHSHPPQDAAGAVFGAVFALQGLADFKAQLLFFEDAFTFLGA